MKRSENKEAPEARSRSLVNIKDEHLSPFGLD